MNDIPDELFEKAILNLHGARSQRVGCETVVERFHGEIVWEGDVLLFELEGHPAKRCFAWEVDGKVTAVLAQGPVESPLDAVRAALLTES